MFKKKNHKKKKQQPYYISSKQNFLKKVTTKDLLNSFSTHCKFKVFK